MLKRLADIQCQMVLTLIVLGAQFVLATAAQWGFIVTSGITQK